MCSGTVRVSRLFQTGEKRRISSYFVEFRHLIKILSDCLRLMIPELSFITENASTTIHVNIVDGILIEKKNSVKAS